MNLKKIFTRRIEDPSPTYRMFYRLFIKELRKKKEAPERYYQGKPNPDVPSLSGMDGVVRLNSTYLEFVDRDYHFRGQWALIGGGVFSMMFFGCFLWPICHALYSPPTFPMSYWGIMSIAWLFFILPVSVAFFAALCSEVFTYTYYPIRLNRKNQMVYMYRGKDNVLAVPWQDLAFVVLSIRSRLTENSSILGCIMNEDGETVREVIPLPANLTWGKESLPMLWEFIRCYMEEDEENLPDLADTIPYCPPVENRREGWWFGMLYLSKVNHKLDLLMMLPLVPFLLIMATFRWVVMQTSKIPVWPEDVEVACRVAADDPVNRGAEHNPPQVWRPMLALQGSERYQRSFAKERGAMDRVIARLKEKYPHLS